MMEKPKAQSFCLTQVQSHFVLSLLCLICFYDSLNNSLVHDDVLAIVNNADVRTNTSVSDIFFNDFWGQKMSSEKSHKSYRPLCVLTFRLNYLLHGLEPYGYHLLNLFLHIAVVNLFFNILTGIVFKDIFSSFVAAMLFATHPVHVEAVTGVVGRADVLSCLVFLIGFQIYSRYLKERVYKEDKPLVTAGFIKFLFLGIICLLVKENAFTIFGVAIVYDIILNYELIYPYLLQISSKAECDKKYLRLLSAAKRILLLGTITVGILCFRLQINGLTLPTFLHEDNPASFSEHLSIRVMTYAYLAVFNIKLLLAPITQCYDWQIGSIPLLESIYDLRNLETTFCFIAFAVVVLSILVRMFKGNDNNYEPVLVGICLLVVPFLPASNIFLRVGFVVAERILYIPSLGFCIIVAYGFKNMYKSTESEVLKFILWWIPVGLVVIFTMKTMAYNKVWKSRETLFKSGVVTLPHNAKAHYNYANFLGDSKRTDEAIYHYKQAVKFYPIHSSAHNNLGVLLTNKEEAEHHFLEAIRHTPGHYRAMLNLATVYRDQYRFIEAEDMLLKCISYAASYYEALLLLADTLHKNKKDGDAHVIYKKLIKQYSDNTDLVLSYATFLLDIGYYFDALNLYTQVMKSEPDNYIALHNTAKIYHQTKRYDQVVSYYERAIAVHPTNHQAYQSLVSFYFDQQEFAKAKVTCKNMIKTCNVTSEHMKNYAIILFKLQEYDEAIVFLEKILMDDNQDLSVHLMLINFLFNLKRYDKASVVIQHALTFFPDNLELRLKKGNLARELKNYSEALQIYLSILEKNKKYFDVLHNVGSVYHIMNEFSNAQKYYQLALQLEPTHRLLLENMEKLKRRSKHG